MPCKILFVSTLQLHQFTVASQCLTVAQSQINLRRMEHTHTRILELIPSVAQRNVQIVIRDSSFCMDSQKALYILFSKDGNGRKKLFCSLFHFWSHCPKTCKNKAWRAFFHKVSNDDYRKSTFFSHRQLFFAPNDYNIYVRCVCLCLYGFNQFPDEAKSHLPFFIY